MTFRSTIIVLLGFLLMPLSPVFCQTKAEIEKVTTITKRVQTNCSALIFLAGLAQTSGDYKKAESCYKKILDIYKSDPGIGPKSAKCAWVLSKIALCELKSDQKPEASKVSKEALALIDGQTPDNNPEEGNSLILTRQNCTQVLGKDMPPPGPAKAPALQLKCIPLSDIANLEEREKQAKAFVDGAEKKSKNSAAHMKDLFYLANIYTLEKKNTEAEPLFKKALALAERKTGKNSPELLTPLSNYGYLLQQAGKQKEADGMLSRMEQIKADAEAGTRTHIGARP